MENYIVGQLYSAEGCSGMSDGFQVKGTFKELKFGGAILMVGTKRQIPTLVKLNSMNKI